jgi:aminomethyltransferase
MVYPQEVTQFVIKPVSVSNGPREFARPMTPPPLVYQELPHGPEFSIYNGRLRSLFYDWVETEELYWRLRRQVGLAHTGELATEIRGPEAAKLLNRVFTRDVSRVRSGRCSYQLACYPDGGMIMDGVLLHFAPDHYWYEQGDGEFRVWLRAQSEKFDVEVSDPDVWVSQVQGPRSMDVLAAAADEGIPDEFTYFTLAKVHIAGQPVVISRTGFTNELGWEFYYRADVDAIAIGERILEAGEAYGIHTIPAAATNARRIEAGLLFAGVDFNDKITPYSAGLGALVDLDREDFVGRQALENADKRQRTWGLQCPDSAALHGDTVTLNGEAAGVICSSAWSPFLQCGVSIVRLEDPELGPGTEVEVECFDGLTRTATVCALPMYDVDRQIPRGNLVDIPEIPAAK